MTKFERVRQILENATGDGSPSHDGKGKFWNLSLAEFKKLTIEGEKLVEESGENPGARSGLIKALKGEPPFDGTRFERMPENRDPVSPADIAFIQKWIDDGCKDDSADSPATAEVA